MSDKKVRETMFLWLESSRSKRGERLYLSCLCSMNSCSVFGESSVGTLLYLLRNSPLVVSYDSDSDFRILEQYNKFAPLRNSIRFTDVQKAIEASCDFRPFFYQTVKHTISMDLSCDSEVCDHVRYGNLGVAVREVEKKAAALRDLYSFLMTNGFVMSQHKDGGEVKRIVVKMDLLQPNYFVAT